MKQQILCLFSFLILTVSAYTQQSYEVSQDAVNGAKVLKGLLDRSLIEMDTAFSWYAPQAADYKPYARAVNVLNDHRSDISFIVFMGTWCHDSQYIIPRFFRLMDAAGIEASHITLIGVDRKKEGVGHLSTAFHLAGTPTIIVMKEGKEIGRVLEYGNSGLFDKELGDIVQKSYAVPE